MIDSHGVCDIGALWDAAARFHAADPHGDYDFATAMLIFVLGVQVEKQRRPVPEILSKEMVFEVQETRTPLDLRL